MGVAYEPTIPLLRIRTRRIIQIGLVAFVLVVAWGVWRAIEPPSFEEQYRTLIGAELIGGTDMIFERMSSPQSLAEARERGHANIYGEFDGPGGERDFVVYQVHESEAAAREAFKNQRALAADYPKFYDVEFYTPDDYHVVTSTYAQYGTFRGNVVILGESWRSKGDSVADNVVDQQAQRLLQAAMKNYLRLFGGTT